MGTDKIRKAWNEAYKPLVADVSNDLTLEEICCIFYELGWKAALERNSTIQWQTGKPKREGAYLIQLKNGIRIDYLIEWKDVVNGCLVTKYHWRAYNSCNIISWCKLSDIKPYKEE